MAAPFRYVVLCGSVMSLLSFSGCAGLGSGKSDQSKAGPDLGPTIGSVAEIVKPQGTPVEGYGLVVELPGTGSAICPPTVRDYLKQYILSQVSDASNLDDLINSPNTAVVRLEGMIPPMAMKGDRFDVRITPIDGSDTTSLRGGRMFRTELKLPGTFRLDTRVFATAEGAIFTDLLGTNSPALKTGYILGGGRTQFDYVGIIRLRQPDFKMASVIRNRVNERYGPDTASGVSNTDVGFRIPAEYRLRQERFIELLGATYLAASAEMAMARVDAALKGLADSADKEASEITLETLGRDSVAGLASLTKSPNEEVRLRAARCLLYLREDQGLETLYAIATDAKSPRRVEAIEAIATGARRNDAGAILRRLLGDDDEQVVRAAFEHLCRLKDPALQEEVINRDFYLDQVPTTRKSAILVSRSGTPRIALLGPALSCRDTVSVVSPGGLVSVKGQPGENAVTVVRKAVASRTRPASFRSSLAVTDIIRTLGGDPTSSPQKRPVGLGVSYAEITALLEQMCQSKALDAQFWPGPLTKFEQTVKK